MRASQAEDTALQAFEEMGSMKDTLQDLKDRLAQVCAFWQLPSAMPCCQQDRPTRAVM